LSIVFTAALVFTGCAANQSPEVSAAEAQERKLALSCFQDREGEKMMYGDSQVWQLCRDWASRLNISPVQAVSSID
jgi:hypothetical protein